jgi:hypothetical protein
MESSVYYAPTCGFYDFKCQETDNDLFPVVDEKGFSESKDCNKGCGKTNFITASFSVKKAEDVTEEDVIGAFEMATNTFHTDKAIKQEAQIYLKQLKKHTKKPRR